jgi:hypothetical protein
MTLQDVIKKRADAGKGGVQLDDLANVFQAALDEASESLAACSVVAQRVLLLVQAGCASRQDLDDWLKVSGVAAGKLNAAAKVWTQMQATQPTEAQQYNEFEKTFARSKKHHEKITSLIVRGLSTKPDLADVISRIEDLQDNIEGLQNEVASLAPARRRSW